MLDMLTAKLDVTQISLAEAQDWTSPGDWESCVGHADTALLLSTMLNTPVSMRRVSTSLAYGDELLVAQYNGPRLPEGAKDLPEGAKIRWYLVRVCPSEALGEVDEETLDEITRANTSFSNFEAMVTTCQGGYVPTLLNVRGNYRLAHALESRGCKVFRG